MEEERNVKTSLTYIISWKSIKTSFSDDLELHNSTTRMFPIFKPPTRGGHDKNSQRLCFLKLLQLLYKKETYV